MLKKVADWFVKIWTSIKKWAIKTYPVVKNWILKNLFMIVNYIVILWSYKIVYGHDEVVGAETLLGLWIFASIGYVGYKFFVKN